jgi:hypothetical protein
MCKWNWFTALSCIIVGWDDDKKCLLYVPRETFWQHGVWDIEHLCCKAKEKRKGCPRNEDPYLPTYEMLVGGPIPRFAMEPPIHTEPDDKGCCRYDTRCRICLEKDYGDYYMAMEDMDMDMESETEDEDKEQ